MIAAGLEWCGVVVFRFSVTADSFLAFAAEPEERGALGFVWFDGYIWRVRPISEEQSARIFGPQLAAAGFQERAREIVALATRAEGALAN